jgi:hypothetical protein
MNVIVNYNWGDKHTFSLSHKLYLEGLAKIDCYKLIIVYDMSEETIDKLKTIYDHVEVIPKPDSHFTSFYTIYKTVEKYCSHCDLFLYTDSHDVIFQSDPFEYLSKFDEEIFLTSPGFKVKDQWPDRNWHEYFNKSTSKPLSREQKSAKFGVVISCVFILSFLSIRLLFFICYIFQSLSCH